MRKNTTMKYVRTITTGHIEADMLGQTLYISEEMKNKQRSSQRPHRKREKTVSELLQEGFEEEQAMYNLKWYQTAPTACWRRLKALISFSNRYGRKLASLMRRKRINGK